MQLNLFFIPGHGLRNCLQRLNIVVSALFTALTVSCKLCLNTKVIINQAFVTVCICE